MKLTLIRTDRETGKESFSILETDALMEKIKKENKAAHISALRFLIPVLQGGTAIQEIRRYASFIGTSNQKDLLTDPSGSRRFICIEVTGPIRTNVSINYRQLYAQAMSAISKGERYWLDDSDETIKTKDRLSINKVAHFGRALHKLGINSRRRNRGNEYHVIINETASQ